MRCESEKLALSIPRSTLVLIVTRPTTSPCNGKAGRARKRHVLGTDDKQ